MKYTYLNESNSFSNQHIVKPHLFPLSVSEGWKEKKGKWKKELPLGWCLFTRTHFWFLHWFFKVPFNLSTSSDKPKNGVALPSLECGGGKRGVAVRKSNGIDAAANSDRISWLWSSVWEGAFYVPTVPIIHRSH